MTAKVMGSKDRPWNTWWRRLVAADVPEGKLTAYANARGSARVIHPQDRNGFQNPSMERILKRSGRNTGSPLKGCITVLVERRGRCN